ncbi:helix-turn-helix domain-containing protein [Micromonospora lupini]|uniref:helix-turn-helix domain-containing protein n=1 Tax=Micromonospora lupini TaxID=285679 RepID=UPI00225401BD|nr:helix-turn-helix domain-containing protein [Micromonospora lupini]MCX5066405.1 helix-turn-helix domain-containing protein [Micromonospora lupini]
MTSPPPPTRTPLGPLLVWLRLARGWSQRRTAAELCAAAGVPTLSRHEVSRWERQRRVPGGFWLGWLAVVLDVPVVVLAEAAACTRRTRSTAAAGPGRRGVAGARPAGRVGPGHPGGRPGGTARGGGARARATR